MAQHVTRRRVCAGAAGALTAWAGSRPSHAQDPGRERDEPKIVDPAGALDRLAAEFPQGTELRRSEHFLVIYDTPAVWARSRTNLLELTHHKFFTSMRRAGFEVRPLRQRLVCILFQRHADFLAYARRKGAVNMEWSDGFYSPRDNRIVFFASQTKPNHAESGEKIAQAQADLAKVDRQIAAATNAQQHSEAARLRRLRANLVKRIGEIQQRHARVVGLSNLAQTVHEAAHQLAFNSGLQNRRSVQPFWVSEGVATAFETTQPAGGFGPGHDNPWRRMDLKRARGRRTLIPWDEFVAMRTAPADEDKRKAAYAQAWALWHVLVNEQPARLRRYMASLNAARRAITGPQLASSFSDTFGVAGDAIGRMVFTGLAERYG